MVYHGKDYAFMGNSSNPFRYIWDGKNLALDNSWLPATITKPGQTNLLANMIVGDWVFELYQLLSTYHNTAKRRGGLTGQRY
jgi:hypothetical protein